MRFPRTIHKLSNLHKRIPISSSSISLPGARAALATRLIAAFGSCRDRYRTAHELQCYSGITPVVESDATQQWIHYRRSCPKFLRQTFQEDALHSMTSSSWERDYYQQQRSKGKSHHSAVRAVAFKWIRILFGCWQDRRPYNPALYESARQSRLREPVHPTSPVKIEWKTRSGFSKLSGVSS
jgi:transposase